MAPRNPVGFRALDNSGPFYAKALGGGTYCFCFIAADAEMPRGKAGRFTADMATRTAYGRSICA